MTDTSEQPIVLKTQGSFAVGGSVITAENGDTAHVDHAYVQFQVPVDARKLPLVMWHGGGGQFAKTWESTPDGRDGYQNIFIRRGFTTYILDQPRRGRGGRASVTTNHPSATPNDALFYNGFRLGTWVPPAKPAFFSNVQFPTDPVALDQYRRQIVAGFGLMEASDEAARNVVRDAGVALFAKIGPAVLVTHSASGLYGWLTQPKSPNVKAIVCYEPANCVFPTDEVPPRLETSDEMVAKMVDPFLVSPEDFAQLTKVPIQIVFGDNISTSGPSPISGVEAWRLCFQRTVQFRDMVNRRGGQVELLHLPAAGIYGNTHFPFSDLNNIQVADLLSAFLKKHNLDGR